MSEQVLQPDTSGTVALSGHENLALSFDLKSGYLKTLQGEIDELKKQMRVIAVDALSRAAAGAVRAFLRNGKRGGVTISRPDETKSGNRLVLSDAKMSKLIKLGELTSLGIPMLELIEEEVTDPGGDVVELRGRWAAWWQEKMAAHSADPDIKVERRERTVVKRLTFDALAKVRALATAGNELAKLLISVSAKELTVTAER